MKKKAGILTVFLLVLTISAPPLWAEIIEINITAEIALLEDGAGLLKGQLSVGSIITGSYIYDSATPDSQPSNPEVGDYWHYSPPYGMFLSGGGFIFQTDPDNVRFLVEIGNDFGYLDEDKYLIRSDNNLPLYNNVHLGEIFWQLDDSTHTALSSDALPTTPPVLEDWDFDWGIQIRGGIPDEYGHFYESFYIQAPVTSVELVPYQPRTYYVNATDGSDDNDGLTPETAFATIQKAIDSAFDGDTVIVADGTYTGPGNRDIDFKGKAITVRSESSPEYCIIDCNGTEADPHRGFYFHSGEDANSLLDGFTITNGYGLEGPFAGHTAFYGGSIYCNGSGPMITNCVIKGNKATFGAGIFAERNSSPIITNCTISGNTKPGGGGQRGGGIYCWRDATATITDCTVSSNAGVGIYCLSSSAEIINCEITNNSVEGICFSNDIINNCIISNNGGAGIVYHSDATISNCIISGNQDPGINVTGGTPTIDNCTITAGRGRGVSCSRGNTIITNSIVWNNTGEDIYVWNHPQPPGGGGSGSTKLSVSYSCTGEPVVEEDAILILGPGNIDADPYFVESGYWDANNLWVEGDYHLLPDSPCIDAGDPNYIPEPNETDLDGNPRVRGDAIDMGAYETIIHEARLLILPRVLNRKSSKPRIMAWVRLPQGITRDQIDSDEPLILYPAGIKAMRQFIIPHRRRGAPSIFAVFDKAKLMDAIPANGRVQLQVLGHLRRPGQYFSGSDTIRIIPRPPKPQPRRGRK